MAKKTKAAAVEKPKKVSKVPHSVFFHFCLFCNKDVPLGWKGAGWHCIATSHRVYVCPECALTHKLPAPNLDTFSPKRKGEAEILPPSIDPVDAMGEI